MADLRCPESLSDRPCALYRGPRRPVSRSLTAAGPIAPSTELALETTQEIVLAPGLRRIAGASDLRQIVDPVVPPSPSCVPRVLPGCVAADHTRHAQGTGGTGDAPSLNFAPGPLGLSDDWPPPDLRAAGALSPAELQDCGIRLAFQHEANRLAHLVRVHAYADAERLVEHCQDAQYNSHEEDHAAERQDPARWPGCVVDGEQTEHQKGAHVDHGPQGGRDLRRGQEQQSLAGSAGVADDRGGVPIG